MENCEKLQQFVGKFDQSKFQRKQHNRHVFGFIFSPQQKNIRKELHSRNIKCSNGEKSVNKLSNFETNNVLSVFGTIGNPTQTEKYSASSVRSQRSNNFWLRILKEKTKSLFMKKIEFQRQ